MTTRTRRTTFSNLGLALLCVAAAFTLAVPATAETIIPSDSLTPDNFDTHWNWFYPWGDTHNGSAKMYVDQVTLDASGMATIVAVTPDPESGWKYRSGAFHSKAQIVVDDQNPEWDIKGEFKAPVVRGSWPAFWPTGAWNWPPEVDILEFKGDNYNWFNTYDGGWEEKLVWVSDAATAWHEYRSHFTQINATDVKVEFYLDGNLVATHTGSNFVGEPFDVIVNMQMEGSSGSPGPTGPTYYYARNIVITRNEASGDGWQKVDDTNANIAYSAGWGTYVGSGGYLNTEHWSETTGSTATFSFNGTQARYYGFKRNDLGEVNIYVDGAFIETLDLYSSSFLADHMLFETDVLSSGSHTLTVELRGSSNSSSSGYEANIDAFSWIDIGGDTTAPTPDPITWAQTPYLNPTWPSDNVATMTATTASDPSGGVQYYFECIEAALGCEDSGWQTGSTFSDWYLISGNTFNYRVKARDALGNETGWSAQAAITVGGGDTTAPAPNPMTWAQTPYLNPAWPSDNVATMTATTASDPSGGVQYYFDCVEAPDGGYWEGCQDSGWQTGSTFSDWYLITGNTFHFRVKARDALGNETGWSAQAAITVGGGGGTDADPATTVAYAPNGVVGQPIRLLVKATDANGTPLSVGGDTITANITGANSASLTFVDNNDGTYLATYTPGLTGTNSVSISLNGTELAISPLSSQVSQGFQLKVMSFNVKRSDLYEWDTWRLTETVNAILEAGADIVGTQEMMSAADLQDVADGVGFGYIDYSSRIASRYPIVDTSPGYGARIEVLPGQYVWVYNTHWGLFAPWDEYYLPYTALSGNYTEAEVIDRARHNWDERSGMTLTLSHITDDMAPAFASGDPVFLVGDFNEPSHLDWTQAAADAGVVPMKVNAPLSNEMLNLGFTDSFRAMRPDEVNDKAHTWTPEYDIIHDRIDFIHFMGAGVTVTDSQVVGEDSLKAEYIISPWPSDHRSVVSTFVLPGDGVPYTPTQTIMSWVASYAIEASKAAVETNLGACSAKDGLTRIGLQFWLVNSDGTLGYDPGVTDADVAWWTNWGATNGIKILLTTHNSDGGWNWPLARSAFADNRTTLVNSLVAELERLNLDGVDLDFEGIGDFESDRVAFSQFISELSVALKSRGKLLTVDSFPYIWNAPNINWYSDWVGEVDNIHSMGYEELYEGGTDWHKYSYQQNTGTSAGYPVNTVLMGMPDWLDTWGTSSGRGTDALAHVQEVRYDLPNGPSGIAIWDLQLRGASWQSSDTWCEIAGLKTGGGGTDTTAPTPDPMTWVQTPYLDPAWPDDNVATMTATTASDPSGGIEYYFGCVEAAAGCDDSGWQTSSTFSDWNLLAGNSYNYRVKARDALGNETGWSAAATISVPGVNTPPTASISYVCTYLDCSFTDNSSDSDGTIVSRLWDFGDTTGSTSQNPSHTYASAGTYTVTLTVTDDDGDTGSDTALINVTEPPPETDHVAIGEIAGAGAVSGNYTATWADDAVTQSITERVSGGKKSRRYSYLEHTWQFNIIAGASVNVYANTWSGGSTDGDNFLFEWSTSSSSGFQTLFSVDNSSGSGSTQLQLIDDTGLLSGTVYIRVRDTDRSAGNKTLDTVYVDQLYIQSITMPGDPPSAPSSLAVSVPTSSSLALNWADNSADETSFTVERSTDGSTFSMLMTLAANTTNFIDIGLSGSTTYWYRVFASNASGSSAPSNVASGTTLVGSSISLTANGYKVKGKQNVDLGWSGTAVAEVDIYRDDMVVPLLTTANDDIHTDAIGNKGGGSYVYKVCEAGTGNCSDTVTVVF